jgi:hypothetical protein
MNVSMVQIFPVRFRVDHICKEVKEQYPALKLQ